MFFTKIAAAAALLVAPIRAVAASFLVADEVGQAVTDVATGSRKSFLGRKIDQLILGGTDGEDNAAQNAQNQKSGNPAIDFWLAQGYTLNQAAGLAANEQAESGGRAGARNYAKGTHYGLYQWSEDRRRQILIGTGIDVANANADQQRLAASWEIKNRPENSALRSSTSAGESAYIVDKYFERSGDNPLNRMLAASNLASQYGNIPALGAGGGSKTVNVKIDDVTIQTAATDASGISNEFSKRLEADLIDLHYDWNDGVDK